MIDHDAYAAAERQREHQAQDNRDARSHATYSAPAYSFHPTAVEARRASLDREFAALEIERARRQSEGAE